MRWHLYRNDPVAVGAHGHTSSPKRAAEPGVCWAPKVYFQGEVLRSARRWPAEAQAAPGQCRWVWIPSSQDGVCLALPTLETGPRSTAWLDAALEKLSENYTVKGCAHTVHLTHTEEKQHSKSGKKRASCIKTLNRVNLIYKLKLVSQGWENTFLMGAELSV